MIKVVKTIADMKQAIKSGIVYISGPISGVEDYKKNFAEAGKGERPRPPLDYARRVRTLDRRTHRRTSWRRRNGSSTSPSRACIL